MSAWNDRIEKTLIHLSLQSQVYSILHEKTGDFNHYFDIFLSITTGFISALTGSLITIPKFDPCSRGDSEMVLFSIFLFISAFITFTQQFLDLKTKSKENIEYSKKYYVLYSKIKNQILLSKEDRVDPKNFMIEIMESLNQNILTQPHINALICWTFLDKLKKKNIFIPNNPYLENIDTKKENDVYSLLKGDKKDDNDNKNDNDIDDDNDHNDDDDNDHYHSLNSLIVL